MGQQIVYVRLYKNGVALGTATYLHKLIVGEYYTSLYSIPPNKWLRVYKHILLFYLTTYVLFRRG